MELNIKKEVEFIPESPLSTNSSPRKCNLSFSFNFDVDGISSDTTDSSTPDLEIDVAEVANYEKAKKRKYVEIEETSAIDEMEEEIERQLDAKAAKTNLTATNVKNILKHVITNEHVLAMVQNSINNTASEDGPIFEPKLTRAKAKELAMTQPNIPWPMTPGKKQSEVQVLISEDLAEDSSDEEYSPDQDASEDDGDQCTNSDLDSQPPTPNSTANQAETGGEANVPVSGHVNVTYDAEGVFKIPSIPHVPTEEESIGQRTRSKLSLSETPLEQIEQAFIPPDITTDMYDWDCDMDEEWNQFLKEFAQPLAHDPVAEDDPEADPEYNILEDKETDLVDKEEFRADKAVKVSRKELNDLVAELFEFEDMFSKGQIDQGEQDDQKRRKMDAADAAGPQNWRKIDVFDAADVSGPQNWRKIDVFDVVEASGPQNWRKTDAADAAGPQNWRKIGTFDAVDAAGPQNWRKIGTFDAADAAGPQNWRKTDAADAAGPQNLSGDTMLTLLPVLAEPELPKIGENGFEHSNLIEIQLQQHVQLMVQHFVMTYRHPEFHSQSIMCKDNLNSLEILKSGENSAFDVGNLKDALVLVQEWEERLEDEKFEGEYLEMWRGEKEEGERRAKRKLKYIPRFHPEIIRIFLESPALIYPELFPKMPFRSEFKRLEGERYSKSEEFLLALGLEQFLPFQEGRKKKFMTKKMVLMDAAKAISEFLMPTRAPGGICNHVVVRRAARDDNPIKFYFKMGYVPSRIHCIALESVRRAPKDQPRSCLPETWREFLEENQSKDPSTSSTSILRFLSESTDNLTISPSLRSSIVHMLPNMPNLEQTPRKSQTSQKSQPSQPPAIPPSQKTPHPPAPTPKPTPAPLASPQLRQKTPRLAKIRSAQNMRLMTQNSAAAPKSLSTPSPKTRKDDSPKIREDSCSSSSKGDNEDEIAELMLASTTIKKDIVNRKKAKQARELENIKRLLEAETEMGQEERATKYAASCIQKLHLTLESSPETLKSAVKILSDYTEKVEETSEDHLDHLAISFYKDICSILKDHPELRTDFLLFLKPHQAALIDKTVEYTMLQKMSEFMNVAQIYFAKQPSRMARIMQALTQLAADPGPALDSIYSVMEPVLKGHPLIMDMFMQIIPSGKPPEILFLSHLFENLTCPVGPYDKNKIYGEDSPELYENIELPVPTNQEDPYGGDNCKCVCHDNTSPSKNSSDHCVSCGVRYLNGRIYLQTAEGLRPAKITFGGDEEEKLDNIARVSMKERFTSGPGRRRKSSKNEASPEENSQKFAAKNSPTKENEEIFKAKRGGKSPPKYVDQRRFSKSSEMSGGRESVVLGGEASPVKSKREKRAERREAKSEMKNMGFEGNSGILGDAEGSTSKMGAVEGGEGVIGGRIDNSDSEMVISEQGEMESSKSDSDTTMETEEKKWSRQDDALLLQHIQADYSEGTFVRVSEILGNRSVQQVKERCETLLSLLEKIV